MTTLPTPSYNINFQGEGVSAFQRVAPAMDESLVSGLGAGGG